MNSPQPGARRAAVSAAAVSTAGDAPELWTAIRHSRYGGGDRRAPLPPRAGQRGVALIITVIMLSVITFMAVTFLAVSRRDRNSVTTATDQTTARLAADAALERARAEALAPILAATNAFNFDLLVSTNFINRDGFDPNPPAGSDHRTNVNFEYQAGGGALTANDARQNLANLMYTPRPPVFITNRLATPNGSNEFRFYLDLNRDGRYTPNGIWPVISPDPANPYYDAAGNPMPGIIPGNTLSNFFIGDPEWIGQLARPEFPHSATNFFTSRYAYLVIPAGKTLDVNYIHNQARRLAPTAESFWRNQGVGSWEINLAALLVDLNTNSWPGDPAVLGGYNYETNNPAQANSGNAFSDALSLLLYRYGGSSASLVSPLPWLDNGNIDEYGNGDATGYPMRTNLWNNDFNDAGAGYPGADNTNHYFTPQELFDPSKTAYVAVPGAAFSARLAAAGTNLSSYDRYTYYRMLAQLGTDSAPETPGKLNLNYDNLVQTNILGIASATNFYAWQSVGFFTNAADRLLKAYTTEWLAADYDYFTNHFQVANAFGVTNIPVFVNGRMVYSPAVHRVLQMAANIWDAKTNRQDGFGPLPTVFRPFFSVSNVNDVYITGFGEIQFTNQLPNRPVFDLTASTNLPAGFRRDDLVYGVPLVVGARKGLPNFNEYSMESIFTITRKIELVKSGEGGQDKIYQTNQFFTMNVYMAAGAEFWNSYKSNDYTRPVDILVNNRVTLSLTNDHNVATNTTVLVIGSMGTNFWPRWLENNANDRSFLVPLRTNISLFTPPTVVYLPGSGVFVGASNATYEVDSRLLFPRWFLTITNRVQAMIVERGTGRIIDYVLLGDLNSYFDLAREIGQDPKGDSTNPFKKLWGTNTIATAPGQPSTSGQPGIYQQIRASRGAYPTINSDVWSEVGIFTGIRPAEIAKFKAFFETDHLAIYSENRVDYAGSNGALRAYAPFTPSWSGRLPMIWQANDPLVHYLGRDMFYAGKSGTPLPNRPFGQVDTNVLASIGSKNEQYKPWSTVPDAIDTDPDVRNLTLKDPLMTSSDDWQFPTNAFPTIGWLGRIHRGTPWQTIYLKASDLGLQPQNYSTNLNNPALWATDANYVPFATKWSQWTGNPDLGEGFFTRPVTDRVLFDQFTTAFNDNAVRGQLSVNQANLAAWSALFSGMVALTNPAPDTLLAQPTFDPLIIPPAGNYDPVNTNAWPPLVKLVTGINAERLRTNSAGQFIHRGGWFDQVGDILSVPELTDLSPFLNRGTNVIRRGMNDAAYEWLPQQVMSLLRLGETRFVVYSFGQTLRPAPKSIVTSGPFFGMCANYQITAEVATRAVVRIEGAPTNSHAVIENYNILPPD